MTNELYEKHCWALVDLDAMQSNLALIQKTVGAPVCCVVKADAYGHGAAVAGPWLCSRFCGQLPGRSAAPAPSRDQ